MTQFTGLTWGHPRGRDPLRAAADIFASTSMDTLTWDEHPLAGFEAAPIRDSARSYDLLVIDHPHLGEAVEQGCLRSWDDVLGERFASVGDAASFVGPSWDSYTRDGALWALPLDAATQTSVVRQDVAQVPSTWADVTDFATEIPSILCLGGPHALLMAYSVGLSHGIQPDPRGRLASDQWEFLLDTLRDLASRCVPEFDSNPIQVLERIRDRGDAVYCPLLYQYVNYSLPESSPRLRFHDAPAGPTGIRGSVVGGTGLALSRRCEPTDALLDHVVWLVSEGAQNAFVPAHNGQPARRSAWESPRLAERTLDFFTGTLATMTGSWVRPRHAGFPTAQNAASALIRDTCSGVTRVSSAARMINDILENAS